jgi:hypothetical protein
MMLGGTSRTAKLAGELWRNRSLQKTTMMMEIGTTMVMAIAIAMAMARITTRT